MQADYAANHDQGRRLDARLLDAVGQGAQGGEQGLLIRLGAVADDGCWRHRGQAMIDHLAADFRGGANPHVEDDGLLRTGQGWPIEIDGAVLEVAGNEGDSLGMIAVGQREAGVSAAASGSGDTGDDFKWNAGGNQGFEFFATTAKDEGVA